ncbi:MAG: hypothetical protein R2692_01000 [Microbacterium sp.]
MPRLKRCITDGQSDAGNHSRTMSSVAAITAAAAGSRRVAARPEPEKVVNDPSASTRRNDRQGEEVGGHHEEDIHPARDPAEPHVVDHDEGDRQGSEAVDVRAVGAGGVGAGLGADRRG